MRRKILAFSGAVEVGTGLLLMMDPAIVVRLLLGVDVPGAGTVLARAFGIALIGLGMAPAFRAMLAYNGLIALYLAYLGTAGPFRGLLLWPAVVLHAAVALALLWTRKDATP